MDRYIVDDIKAHIDLRAYIERDLGQPEHRGDSWVFRCPFHSEATVGGFHVFKDGYKCFSCGQSGDIIKWRMVRNQESFAQAVEALNGGPVNVPIDPKKQIEDAVRRAEEAAQRAEKAAKEIERIQEEMRKSQSWLRYHDQMGWAARNIWLSRGVPDEYQDWWKLGYDPDHIVWAGTTEYHTPTLTIPIYEPGTWEVLNIRHRLLNPPKPHDKYRPERSGLPAPLFVADPDEPISGKTLIVEGEIKAMVSFVTADEPGLQVVGIPGKTPPDDLLRRFEKCDPVYICLDPDAANESVSIAASLGADRCRLITLPEKIDDLIIRCDLDSGWMKSLLRTAKKV